MSATDRIKSLISPRRGDLKRVEFREGDRWLTALLPDDAVVGLTREMLLERMYDTPGRRAEIVVDAGAHVGLYTLIASQRARRVIALEPDPVNFRTLALNLQLNGLSNVDARHVALWRESGTVIFADSEHSEGGHVAETGREVASVSIEDLVRELGRIDLLKMDIEGAEFEVLENADLSGVDAIVGELHVRDQRDEDRLVSHLAAAGFAVEVIPEEVMTSASKAPQALRRWGAVRGRSAMKAASIAYLLLPVDKGRLQTMHAPLFTAFRTPA